MALLGDLAFLHDAPGLMLGPDEPRPDLCLVVVNNDGGGIFSDLEQAAFPGPFERVFGTPHGADIGSLARGGRAAVRQAGPPRGPGRGAGRPRAAGGRGADQRAAAAALRAELRAAGTAAAEGRTRRLAAGERGVPPSPPARPAWAGT